MQRYKIRCNDCDPKITPHENGKWVRWGDVERLRAELAEYRQKNALLREALDDAAERMDRARGIIRTPHGVGWAMLDTTTQRAALAAEGENSDV